MAAQKLSRTEMKERIEAGEGVLLDDGRIVTKENYKDLPSDEQLAQESPDKAQALLANKMRELQSLQQEAEALQRIVDASKDANKQEGDTPLANAENSGNDSGKSLQESLDDANASVAGAPVNKSGLHIEVDKDKVKPKTGK